METVDAPGPADATEPADAPTVDTEEARRLVLGRAAVVLDALDEESHRRRRLPGAVSAPADAPDFEARVRAAAPDRDAKVLVYCLDEDCQASPKAARRLRALGYRNVVEYPAGLAGWRRAGLPTEGEAPRRIRADVE